MGIFRDVSLDATKDRDRDFFLVSRVVQSLLLVGIADECRLDEDGRDVRRLQHRKAGLLDLGLVEKLHTAQLPYHGPSELQTFADLGGQAKVGKSIVEIRVLRT